MDKFATIDHSLVTVDSFTTSAVEWEDTGPFCGGQWSGGYVGCPFQPQDRHQSRGPRRKPTYTFSGTEGWVRKLGMTFIIRHWNAHYKMGMRIHVLSTGHVEFIQSLIDQKYSVHAANKDGLTALHVAALHHRSDVLETLLGYSALVDAKGLPWRMYLICEAYTASGMEHHCNAPLRSKPWIRVSPDFKHQLTNR